MHDCVEYDARAENELLREAMTKIARQQLTGETGHDEAVRTCQKTLAICDQMGG